MSQQELEDMISSAKNVNDTGLDEETRQQYRNLPWKYHAQEASVFSIGWQCLRKKNWLNKVYNGEKIVFTERDVFFLMLKIIILSLFTNALIFVVMYDMLDLDYEYVGYQMVLTRVVAQYFMHRSVINEFRQGSQQLKQALWRRKDFSHPKCAAFIGFLQALQSSFVVIVSIIMISCMTDLFTLITKFACLTILTKLDNFEAGVILQEKIILDNEFQGEEFKAWREPRVDGKPWNRCEKKVGLLDKLALLRPDLKTYNYDYDTMYCHHFKHMPVAWFLKVVDIDGWLYYSWFINLVLSYYLPAANTDFSWQVFLDEANYFW